VGDRDERRGSIGTLGMNLNWIGAGGERMGRRGLEDARNSWHLHQQSGGQD